MVQNKTFYDNDHRSGTFGLIDAHQVLTGDRIFDCIEDKEMKLDQGLFQHLQREEVEVQDI